MLNADSWIRFALTELYALALLAHPSNFFGNVFLFLPLGFFEVLLHPSFSRRKQLFRAAAIESY